MSGTEVAGCAWAPSSPGCQDYQIPPEHLMLVLRSTLSEPKPVAHHESLMTSCRLERLCGRVFITSNLAAFLCYSISTCPCSTG